MRSLLALAFVSSLIAGCGAPGPAARPTLGSLVTHDHIVVIEQSPDGVRYSLETREGDVVASNLTRDELETLAPGAARHLETGTGRLLAE